MNSVYRYSFPRATELAILRFLSQEGESSRSRVVRLVRYVRSFYIDSLISKGLIVSRVNRASGHSYLQITKEGRELLLMCESSSLEDAHMFAPKIDELYQGGH